jgi:phosphoglycerol transferase
MPNAYGIGDILSKEGYTNYFILGSEAEFGGRDKYFKTHGDTIIYDYRYFLDNGLVPKSYRVWWGFEDRKLYQFTKEKLLEIAKSPPFFLTLLTADTHPVDGYLDNEAEKMFGSQYENVLYWRVDTFTRYLGGFLVAPKGIFISFFHHYQEYLRRKRTGIA